MGGPGAWGWRSREFAEPPGVLGQVWARRRTFPPATRLHLRIREDAVSCKTHSFGRSRRNYVGWLSMIDKGLAVGITRVSKKPASARSARYSASVRSRPRSITSMFKSNDLSG